MKRLLNYAFVLVMGSIFMAGTCFAWNATEHVTVSPNGKGDAGIFPLYLAFEGGWQTKIEVINTSPTRSVVAKVVVRTPLYSQESLDFFIYLSPTDVWTGILEYGPRGATRLYSTDDSCHAGTRLGGISSAWASQVNPMDVDLLAPCDVDYFGYVEVIEAWDGFITAPPVKKDLIETAFNAAVIGPDSGTSNSLAMHYEINLAPAFNAADRAVVLRDYDVTQKLSLGFETFLGSSAGSRSRNSFGEVEAVLAKNEVAMPYYGSGSGFLAYHFLTFPVKYTELTDACAINNVKSPFFLAHTLKAAGFSLDYGFFFWDMEENTPTPTGGFSPVPPDRTYRFPYEVNLVDPSALSDFEEGWVLYEFDYNTSTEPESSTTDTVIFNGAPVIPTTLLIKGSGMSLMSGAWTDGDVIYNNFGQPFYHYGPYPK